MTAGRSDLRRCEAEIPAAVRQLEEAERLAHAEVEATRAMLVAPARAQEWEGDT